MARNSALQDNVSWVVVPGTGQDNSVLKVLLGQGLGVRMGIFLTLVIDRGNDGSEVGVHKDKAALGV